MPALMIDVPADTRGATYRPAIAADVLSFAPRARPADEREFYRFAGLSMEGALNHQLSCSRFSISVVARDDGQVHAMFGVQVNLLGTVGWPWFAASTRAPELVREFGRARAWIAVMQEMAPRLEGWVDPDNALGVSLVEAAGFTLEEPAPAGLFGHPFRRFWRADPCAWEQFSESEPQPQELAAESAPFLA